MVEFSENNLKTYYSEDETGLYVLTDSLPRLRLKEKPEPADAPLYMDIETGEAYHPSSISREEAEQVARYAAQNSPGNSLFELNQSTDRWEEEFSELFDSFDTGSVQGYSINLDETPEAGSPRSTTSEF